jgi:Xaa-Pro aminopeptidase
VGLLTGSMVIVRAACSGASRSQTPAFCVPSAAPEYDASVTATARADIAAQIERRRSAVAERWDLEDEVVLIGAGEPIFVPGRGDRFYPFRAHSEYLYLTDRERPGGVLAFDPGEGWIDFVVPVSEPEIVWEGAHADDVQGAPIEQLDEWLRSRRGRPAAWLGSPDPGHDHGDLDLRDRVRRGLNHIRRPKDELELARIRAAVEATKLGFEAVREAIAPGMTERALRVELEAGFMRAGGEGFAFDSIVASGPNSAVLHFPPTTRRLNEGELVLIDAGAERRAYVADVTRTYAISGALTGMQSVLYEAVERACQTAIERCRVGTEWTEVHRSAALVLAEGLVEAGVLRGEAESLFERGAVALFSPHGIGHMFGLGVRDASEILTGRAPDPALYPSLRMDLPLLAGYTVTVEPGCYFIPALLGDPERRARQRDAVDWEKVESLYGFGGIRIEHDVLVTDGRPEVLTREV